MPVVTKQQQQHALNRFHQVLCPWEHLFFPSIQFVAITVDSKLRDEETIVDVLLNP